MYAHSCLTIEIPDLHNTLIKTHSCTCSHVHVHVHVTLTGATVSPALVVPTPVVNTERGLRLEANLRN